jgi:cholest-4-en-3-one 26-monooxygenase
VTELADRTTAFDPTDPDVMRTRVPHEELLTLRRTAPVSFVEQTEPRRLRHGWINGVKELQIGYR